MAAGKPDERTESRYTERAKTEEERKHVQNIFYY
jgi:hypothetical protein